ncbi:MAG: two-component system, OmpR family, phosphate regulon response regulator PhoB [Baekduia sp.]|jgi:DNA-binding NarL/FixJ family response regulator|nr:two-component system, OmpR family, phosphate regulon response regulator PhoB [Baekduia sp.]
MPDAVLIADPDAGARHELGRVLESAGFRVLEAAEGDEALAKARSSWPAAAILEIPLGTLSGYEVCRALKTEMGPELAVIFLSGVRTESYDCVAGLMLGADDYVVKPSAPDEVLARLRNVMERIRPQRLATHGRLTRREHEVLGLLGEGLKWADIAARLTISPKTVATHVENIRRKLGVNSRAEAIAVAYRDELLPPPAGRTGA